MGYRLYQKSNMEKIIKKGLIILLIICSSFLLIYFIRLFCGFIFISEIDYSVNAFEYVSLIITSFLTLIVAWYITKRLTEQRFEKDFLINDLKSIEEIVHSIEDLLETSSSINITHMASKINSIFMLKNRMKEAIELTSLFGIDIRSLENSINDLFTSATNFDAQDVPISDVDIPEIQQRCTRLIKETRSLIIKINNK